MSIRTFLKGQLRTAKNVGKAWNVTSVGAENLDAGTLLVGMENGVALGEILKLWG